MKPQRYTVITELAEMGVPDHVSESISGHLSKTMLEHYSHVRIDAKRKALDAVDVQRQEEGETRQPQDDTEAREEDSPALAPSRMVVSSTSHRTSQSVWAGSVERGKLLIPFERRDVRVVEGARLEIGSLHAR